MAPLSPSLPPSPQTWGMVAGVGMSSSCFFLAAMLCGLYRFFALPLPSSFHLAGRRAMGELGSRCRLAEHERCGLTCRCSGWADCRAGSTPAMWHAPAAHVFHHSPLGGTTAAGGGKPKAHKLQDSGDGFAAFLLVSRWPMVLGMHALAQALCRVVPLAVMACTRGHAGLAVVTCGPEPMLPCLPRSLTACHLLPHPCCVQVAALPVGVYVATHWAVLFSWVHMWSLILLATGPLVFVCSLQGAQGAGRSVCNSVTLFSLDAWMRWRCTWRCKCVGLPLPVPCSQPCLFGENCTPPTCDAYPQTSLALLQTGCGGWAAGAR